MHTYKDWLICGSASVGLAWIAYSTMSNGIERTATVLTWVLYFAIVLVVFVGAAAGGKPKE